MPPSATSSRCCTASSASSSCGWREKGKRLRVLISYGEYWFPWYMRRLAERPANVWFVAKNSIGSGHWLRKLKPRRAGGDANPRIAVLQTVGDVDVDLQDRGDQEDAAAHALVPLRIR